MQVTNATDKFLNTRSIHYEVFYNGTIRNLGTLKKNNKGVIETVNNQLTENANKYQWVLAVSDIKTNAIYGGVMKTPAGKFYEVFKSYAHPKLIPLPMVVGTVKKYAFT